jgi:L-ascorbate metabolism protein UlaG (beta-lactamase superfamily)
MNETGYQAKAPDPIPLKQEAFTNTGDTATYWLTGAGILINSHGTTIMVDPILSLVSQDPPLSEVEGTPQYVMPPIDAQSVPRLDAVLYTHADEDHMGPVTVGILAKKGFIFHGTEWSGKRLAELGVPEQQIVTHAPLSGFDIGCITVQMTAANHPWQLDYPERHLRVYKPEDCCGYKFYTPDGVVWHPGDSKFLPEHLDNTDVDLLYMDFENNSPAHHFGTEAALKIVNHLCRAEVIMFHWGTYYAPEKCWYAADPEMVRGRIENPDRWLEPHPGEKVTVHRINSK